MATSLSDHPKLNAFRAHFMPQGWAHVRERQEAGDFLSDPKRTAQIWAGRLACDAILRGDELPCAIADSLQLRRAA